MQEFEAERQNQPQDDLQQELKLMGITDEKPFDLADPVAIAANRHGEITSTQINMFKNARSRLFRWHWLIFICMFPSAILLMQTGLVQKVNFPFLEQILIICLLIAAISLILPISDIATYIHQRRLKSALAQRKVEEVRGEVIKIGRKVLAQSEGRHLKMVDSAYPLPLEGHYLFFVLAGTNYLLSAQSLDGAEPGVLDAQEGEKLLVRLSLANKFTLDELALNREGCLSERQRERLLLVSVKAGIGGSLTVIGFILGIYLFIVWNLAQFAWLAWIGASFAGLVLFGIALAAFLTCIQSAQDRRDGRVVPQDGPLKRIASVSNGDNSSSASYSYEGKFTYKVSKEAYQALIPDLRYRVYHTPRQHRLMSIEPLDEKE